MNFRVTNGKINLFHNILNANDWRLCKKITVGQEG